MKRTILILSCMAFCILINSAKATGLWSDYAATIPALGVQYGKYDKWPVEEKRGFFVCLLRMRRFNVL